MKAMGQTASRKRGQAMDKNTAWATMTTGSTDLTIQAGCDKSDNGPKVEKDPRGIATGSNPVAEIDLEEDSDSNDCNDCSDSNSGVHPASHPTQKRHDKASSMCLFYVGIVLAGCALAALVLVFGIREQRTESKRRFELDGTCVPCSVV